MPAAVLEHESHEQEQQPIREFIAKAQDSYPVVKLGIEKLSSLPGASQVQKLSNPILDTVDHSLVRAYAAIPFSIPSIKSTASDGLIRAKQHVPESVTQWFTRVDDILTKARNLDVQQVTTTTAEVKQSIQAFYATSVDHFLVLAKAKLNVQLHVTSNNGVTNGHDVTRDEFVNGLRNKLKHVWDDSLVAPAELFYERAKTLYVDHIGTKVHALTHSPPDSPSSTVPGSSASYLSFLTNLRAKLGAEWEEKVVEGLYPTLRIRVSQPAQELYTSALNHYLKLRENQRIVQATEFIQSYKQAIGSAWNDRLEQPLREVVGTWKKSRTEDLQKLHDSLDYDQNGYLTVSDFVDTSRFLVNKTQSRISQQWQSVLHGTINTFDAIIPDYEHESKQKQADEEITPVTVTGVATHVTQRLKDRTNMAYTAVRQRAVSNVDYVRSTAQSRAVDGVNLVRQSSSRLAPYIHIDIVNVAEDLLQKRGKPAYQSVQSRIEHATQQVRISLDQLQTTLSDVTNKAKSHIPVEAVTQQWNHVTSTVTTPVQHSITQLQHVRDSITTRVQSTVTSTVDTVQHQPSILELQRKLRDTILHAKSLVNQSNEYVLHRQISLIPSDFLSTLQQSRIIAKSQEVSHETITRVTTHLNDVIVSLQHLLHWNHVATEEDIPHLTPSKPRFNVAPPQGEIVSELVAAIEEKEAEAAAAAAATTVKSPIKTTPKEDIKKSPVHAPVSGKKHKKKGKKHEHEEHDE